MPVECVEAAELTKARDMMLVVLAAFSRNHSVTMNCSERMDALPCSVAQPWTITRLPMPVSAAAPFGIVCGLNFFPPLFLPSSNLLFRVH